MVMMLNFHDFSIFILCIGEIVLVIASLGAVIAVLCLIIVGTVSVLLTITHKYYKKGTGRYNIII